jgi:hypothetical protein
MGGQKDGSRVFKNKNIQECLCVFALGVALLCYSLVEHYGGPHVEWKMSPYLFPSLVAVFLMLLGVSLLFDGLGQLKAAKRAPGTTSGKDSIKEVKWKTVLVTIALAVVYYLVLPFLTFIPATIVFLAAFMFFLGERRYWLIVLIAVISSVVLWAIFGIALGVMLP